MKRKMETEDMPKRIKTSHDCLRSRETDSLSDDVVEYIFSFLPIKLAIEIGALSSRFRNSWVYSRNLDFDKEFTRGRSPEEFIRIVDRVLNLHLGNKVYSFRLFFNPSQKFQQVEEWIRFAIMKGVEEVDLDFSPGRNLIKVPDYLLNCGSVTVLSLTLCEFRPPFSFTGLPSLTTLSLRQVDVTEVNIQLVFQTCLLLEKLDLTKCLRLYSLRISAQYLGRFKVLKVTECYNLSCLNINAPTLHSLHYSGNVKRLIFSSGSTSNLRDAKLDFTASVTKVIEETFYMKNLPIDLANVNILTVSSIFLEGVAPKYVDGELKGMQVCLRNLKEFQLSMETTSYCNPYDIALFLKNCPILERIFIDLKGFSFYHGYYWELHGKQPLEQLDCKFQHLKSVKLRDFKFEKHELLLVKFVLEKAIVLETLFIEPHKNHHQRICAADMQRHQQLFLSWRASPKAKITVSENPKDPTHSSS